MRCFVAVDLDPKLRTGIQELQKELAGMDTKLVEPENLHFTLKFLGEVDEDLVHVKSMLTDLAGSVEAFGIDIGGAGIFPNEKFIRVVWIGAPKLTNLQDAVNQKLSTLFKKEKPYMKDAERRPIPHLTIARVRSQKHASEILSFLAKHSGIEIGSMRVEEIKLKKSIVTNKGSIYEDISVFKLGSD